MTIYIEIYRIFNKISRFLKFGKSIKIFLNIFPSTFGSLEKIVLARAFKGQSAFFSYRFYYHQSDQKQRQNFPAKFHSHFVSFRRRKILTKKSNKKKTVGKTQKIFRWKKISKNIQSYFRTWLGEMSKFDLISREICWNLNFNSRTLSSENWSKFEKKSELWKRFWIIFWILEFPLNFEVSFWEDPGDWETIFKFNKFLQYLPLETRKFEPFSTPLNWLSE